MKFAIESYDEKSLVNGEVIVLALIIFIGGLASGVILLQSLQSNHTDNTSEETLDLTNQYAWYNQTGWSGAALVIVNTGERDVIIRKVTVRGMECGWNTIYYWKTDTGPVSEQLKQTPVQLSGNTFDIVIDGEPQIFHKATTELTLLSGWTIVLYINDPGNITSNDVGQEVTITIFTENKLYYIEAYVDTLFTFTRTEEMTITSMVFPNENNITLTVKNTGSSRIIISVVTVNGEEVPFTTDHLAGPNEWDIAETGHVYITKSWVPGNRYEVVLQSNTGTNVASYIGLAP